MQAHVPQPALTCKVAPAAPHPKHVHVRRPGIPHQLAQLSGRHSRLKDVGRHDVGACTAWEEVRTTWRKGKPVGSLYTWRLASPTSGTLRPCQVA